MNHRAFVIALACCSLFGCGKKGLCEGRDLSLAISGNHGHTQKVAAAEFEKSPHTIRLEGEAGHDHVVRLRDPDLETIKGGGAVTVRSSSMNAHVHEIEARCAPE